MDAPGWGLGIWVGLRVDRLLPVSLKSCAAYWHSKLLRLSEFEEAAVEEDALKFQQVRDSKVKPQYATNTKRCILSGVAHPHVPYSRTERQAFRLSIWVCMCVYERSICLRAKLAVAVAAIVARLMFHHSTCIIAKKSMPLGSGHILGYFAQRLAAMLISGPS